LPRAVYNISYGIFIWEGGVRGGKKFSRNISESFAKILAKFYELKILTKPQHYLG